MNDASNTASDDIQADEKTLTHTVSDEALEAAAGTERGGRLPDSILYTQCHYSCG
jgi:hypothetical protein